MVWDFIRSRLSPGTTKFAELSFVAVLNSLLYSKQFSKKTFFTKAEVVTLFEII